MKSLLFQMNLSYVGLLLLVVVAFLISLIYFNIACNQQDRYNLGVSNETIHINIELNAQSKVFEISDQNGNSLNKPLIEALGIFIGIVIIGILALGMWINYKVKRPLADITNALIKMQSGDYEMILDFKAISDFEIIKDSFNTMTAALRKSLKEQKAMQQSQKNLLLNLSHDIKTPVASIKAYASALNDGLVVEEDKKKRYYNTILLKTERIAELVDQMFDLLKLENIQYTLNMEEKDLCEVMRESIVEYYEEIEERGFELNINLPDKQCLILMDEKYFKRVIGNLLLNALKYNDEGTQINISVEEEDGFKIIISDNGAGIPKRIQGEIFNPFVRGDESRNSNGGTGLGLAIVKLIVERHGWQIEYIPCNLGSKFIIYMG